jgi:hypothetical protein
MIQAKKKMITIAWNPHDFHAVNALLKGESFNATYYIEHILSSIFEYCLKSGCASLPFMQTMQDRIRPESPEHLLMQFPQKRAASSMFTRFGSFRLFFSDMSNIA